MRAIIVLLLACLLPLVGAESRHAGMGKTVAEIATTSIVVYTYRPRPCERPKLLLVFAGYNRNAASYRDRSIGIAERACFLIVAPLLDRDRFPTWRYQRGGVWRDGQLQNRKEWSGRLVDELVKWARGWAKDPGIPYFLFGHSAGAQFLSRVAAYDPPPVPSRIIIANPSAHVMPSTTEFVPYGFAGIFGQEERLVRLRQYLKLPITIYLGQIDTGDRLLVTDEPAMRQGSNRYERGRAVFKAAEQLANRMAWDFGWKLVEVPGVGHSSTRMLNAPEAITALDPASAAK